MVNNILLLPLNPFASGCNMEHLAGHVLEYSITMDGVNKMQSLELTQICNIGKLFKVSKAKEHYKLSKFLEFSYLGWLIGML